MTGDKEGAEGEPGRRDQEIQNIGQTTGQIPERWSRMEWSAGPV